MSEPLRARADLQVIIPNFNWRYSGVTSVNRTIAPLLARRCRVAWLGTHRPGSIAPLGLRALVHLRFARAKGALAIWHARRNVEMIVGLVLRGLGFPFVLVFTSEAQRQHTWITRALIARMDAVIATSRAAASYLRRAATIIPHGIDTDVYCPPADRAAAFAATGLPGSRGIGAFGRVRPQKGTDVFVAAMCRLLPRYPDFTALVIGRVTMEHRAFHDDLCRQAEAAGLRERIRFLGELPPDEVPRWYQSLAIYAFTSREEGFGLTLLEAMAAGNALIAARAGVADVAVVDGETGVLVPPGDPDALADAVAGLLSDPAQRDRLGSAARRRIEAEFPLRRMIDGYEAALQAVIE
jgi:mannosyltransferase